MTKPFRVLVGTEEIVRQVYELGEGFRELGHDVTTVVAAESPFYPDAAYDVVLEPRSDHRVPNWRRPVDRRLGQLHGLARLPADAMRHDVFVFQFGQTLLPGGRDLPILRRAGKTVISCFLGSDIRHWSATEQFRRSVKLGTYPGYREGRSIDRALESLRMAELYSTVSFFQPSYAELAVLPYQHLYLALDLRRYVEHIPGREVPVVVHAPSKRSVKGTAEILDALEHLRREGLRFELRLLENTPNDEVLRILTDADIVVDELNEAHYGMLALEAMASGCVVLAGNRPDIVPIPSDRPVIHVHPENLVEALRAAIVDRAERVERALSGRPFVAHHHERAAVAGTLLDGVQRAHRGHYDYSPRFFLDEFTPVDGALPNRRSRALTRRLARGIDISTKRTRDLERRGLA